MITAIYARKSTEQDVSDDAGFESGSTDAQRPDLREVDWRPLNP